MTENYAKKADSRQGGVGFETMLTTPVLLENKDKLVFITRHNGDRSKAIPFHLKSFYVIDFSDGTKFNEKFKELLHRIYKVPLYEKAIIGKKPNLHPEKIEIGDNTEIAPDLEVINTDDSERVIWLLPRGFLIFDDITYEKYDHWSVVSNYYDYTGEWHHGTHYHESYRDTWDKNIEIQLRKLSIPSGDWLFARPALRFLQELREVPSKIDMEAEVEKLKNSGRHVYYYPPSTPAFLPSLPEEYRNLSDTGDLRDIAADIYSLIFDISTNVIVRPEIRSTIQVLRRRAHLWIFSHYDKDHPAVGFINEVNNKYSDTMSSAELKEWIKEFHSTINDILYTG
ncbi:hypothetical protein [Geosporobacter ferrireducens]|uniref:SEFIR domain-containing protein n=1 Tax=Geosporobacter ferrireducens TaxID=1424294 RepID=A0A1D8GI24_9FIRM|nr:hypothetical protein [Geosporobacter ferrireducens]AOT70555.1 hypothetical protein Gferi_13825 [Geosporobacter ferrireducens]